MYVFLWVNDDFIECRSAAISEMLSSYSPLRNTLCMRSGASVRLKGNGLLGQLNCGWLAVWTMWRVQVHSLYLTASIVSIQWRTLLWTRTKEWRKPTQCIHNTCLWRTKAFFVRSSQLDGCLRTTSSSISILTDERRNHSVIIDDI